MRKAIVASGLMLSGFAGWASAQTWESPLTISGSSYSNAQNSCYFPTQTLNFEYGFYTITAPAVIYRVTQFSLPPKYIAKPWHLTLQPTQYVDFSLWVCRTRSGNFVSNCVDASDNLDLLQEHVTVPSYIGSYYVIVTGGTTGLPPTCGGYVLSGYRS